MQGRPDHAITNDQNGGKNQKLHSDPGSNVTVISRIIIIITVIIINEEKDYMPSK